MQPVNPILQPVQRVWRGLSQAQRIGFDLIVASLVGLVAIVSTVEHSADSAVAFSGLSNDDEAAIVQKLKDAKIPYTLDDGGTIRVPSGVLQEARLATAGMGLNGKPATGSGFELFNQPTFGQTEFTQKVNYQRALESELARSTVPVGEELLGRVIDGLARPIDGKGPLETSRTAARPAAQSRSNEADGRQRDDRPDGPVQRAGGHAAAPANHSAEQ